MVKTLPANAGDTGSIPDREDPLEEGMAIHDGILVLEMPWTGEPGGLQSTGSQRVRDDLATKQPQLKKSLRHVDIRLWQTLFKTVFFFLPMLLSTHILGCIWWSQQSMLCCPLLFSPDNITKMLSTLPNWLSCDRVILLCNKPMVSKEWTEAHFGDREALTGTQALGAVEEGLLA